MSLASLRGAGLPVPGRFVFLVFITFRVIPAIAQASDPPPARVVNHQHLPVVGDQGVNEVCLLFHRVYYGLTYIKAKEHGWTHPDPATHPERVMAWEFARFAPHKLQTHGCATYADIAPGWNGHGWPTRAQWEAALLNRIEGTEQVVVTSAATLEELKTRLADGEVGFGSMDATPGFQQYGEDGDPPTGVNNDVFYSDAGQNGAAHGVTIIGYDDDKSYVDGEGVTRQGAFLAVNSWGTDWGVNLPEVGTRGFIWLAYDFVLDLGMSVDFLINRPEDPPVALAVVEWEHELSEQMVLDLVAGRPQDPQWTQRFSVNLYGESIRTRMAIDITEPYEQGLRDFWVRGAAADFVSNGDPLQGTIHYFAVELPGAPEPWTCAQTPVRTVDLGSISDPEFVWISTGLIEDAGVIDAGGAMGGTRQIWGDFDGDGRHEGVLHGYQFEDSDFWYPTMMMLPDGEGGLRVKPAGLPDTEELILTSGDLDNDGRLDLLTYGRESRIFQAWNYSSFGQQFSPTDLSSSAIDLGYNGAVALVDFNNDGLLDLATLPCLGDETSPIGLRIWLRQADGGFVDSGVRADLRQNPTYYPAMAWADFDGDGWRDVALTATATFHSDYYDEDYDDQCVVWLRNENGTGFSEYARCDVYDVPEGNITFGDADNDGRPDLAFASINVVYLNHGPDQLERRELGLNFYNKCHIDWVDIDNDGWSDLVTTGDRGDVRDYYTVLWHNHGNGTFSSALGALPGLWLGSLGQVDLDADGDVDLIGAGWIEDVACWSEREMSLRLFRNRTAQPAGYGRPNQPPDPPTALQASVDGGGTLTLNWDSPADDHTPADALRYHLRVDSQPGWHDVVSGALGSDLPANRSIGRLGSECGALVAGLPDRLLYAAVQAVDAAGRRSAWSAFTPVASAAAADGCDINRDGRVDVADLVTCQRILGGLAGPAGSEPDVNADGSVGPLDRQFVINRLIGHEAPAREVVAMQRIGPGGGRIQLEGFDMQISPGQLPAPTMLTVWRMPSERPDGTDSVSPLFRISGLPENGLTSFTLSLRADRPYTDPPLLAYGLNGRRTSGGYNDRGMCHFEPAGAADPWFNFTIDLPGAAAVAATKGKAYEFSNVDGWFGLASGKAMVKSDHFQTVFPVHHDYVAITQLVNALEAAYDAFKEEFLFTYLSMPQGRIQVEVLDRGPNEYGSFLNLPGTEFDKLEFNTKDIVRDNSAITATAYHEFAHCVHSQFFSSLSNPYYWLDEASAVWSETRANPALVPAVYNENAAAAMRGLFAGGSSSEEKHGYGMASLIRYIEERQMNPPATTSLLWHRIGGGATSAAAILDVLGELNFDWYTYFLEQHVQGQLFAYDYTDINRDAPDARTIEVSAMDMDHPTHFSGSVPDLGAHLYQVRVDEAGLPIDAMLSHRLVATEHFDLSGFHYLVTEEADLLGRGALAGGAIRLDLPIGGWTADPNDRRRALAMITNREGNAAKSYTSNTPYELDVAVTWDRTYTMPSATAVHAQVYAGVPRLLVTGAIEGPGLTSVTMEPIQNINPQGDAIGIFNYATLMGAPPLELELDFDATITLGSNSESSGSGIVYEYSVAAIDFYRMEYYTDSDFQNVQTAESADGRFILPITVDMDFLSCTVEAVYDVTITTWVDGSMTGTRQETDRTTAVGGFYLSF